MALHIFHANPVILLKAGAKLEGCVTPPPKKKYESSVLAGRIIWIGRAIKDFK
jgi:hypothetical protein